MQFKNLQQRAAALIPPENYKFLLLVHDFNMSTFVRAHAHRIQITQSRFLLLPRPFRPFSDGTKLVLFTLEILQDWVRCEMEREGSESGKKKR